MNQNEKSNLIEKSKCIYRGDDKYTNIRIDISYYRGRYIDETIIMEMLVDDFLSRYFCEGNKVSEILSGIFNTEYISTGYKISILKSILMKPQFKEFWDKNNWIIDTIKHKILKYRNKLAHSKALITQSVQDGYNDEDLPLVGCVDGEQISWNIKMSDINEKVKEVQGVIKVLLELQKNIMSEPNKYKAVPPHQD